MITMYTDGSCSKNPGPGGFGVVVLESWDNESFSLIEAHQEKEKDTTNNREEMKAILWALKTYGGEEYRGNGFLIPVVYSDSAYCVNTFTNWIKGWKTNGWTRAGGKKIENLDLVKRYDELLQQGKVIDLRKCKGHSDNFWNNIADGLATGRLTVDEVMKEYGNNN